MVSESLNLDVTPINFSRQTSDISRHSGEEYLPGEVEHYPPISATEEGEEKGFWKEWGSQFVEEFRWPVRSSRIEQLAQEYRDILYSTQPSQDPPLGVFGYCMQN